MRFITQAGSPLFFQGSERRMNKASARFWSPFPTRRPAATAGNPCDFVGCGVPWGQEESSNDSNNNNNNNNTTSSGSAGNNEGGGYATQLSAKENTRVFSVFPPRSTFLQYLQSSSKQDLTNNVHKNVCIPHLDYARDRF